VSVFVLFFFVCFFFFFLGFPPPQVLPFSWCCGVLPSFHPQWVFLCFWVFACPLLEVIRPEVTPPIPPPRTVLTDFAPSSQPFLKPFSYPTTPTLPKPLVVGDTPRNLPRQPFPPHANLPSRYHPDTGLKWPWSRTADRVLSPPVIITPQKKKLSSWLPPPPLLGDLGISHFYYELPDLTEPARLLG